MILFSLSLMPILFCTVSSIKNSLSHKELFNIELSRFQTIDDITAHIDGIYSAQYSLKKIDTTAYVKICSEIVKRRFYHGLSNYTLNENWIAFLSGKLFWPHLSAIVEPDDILNYNEALCSQQTIVFMEILTRKGIKNRNVGIGSKDGKGHFLAEVFYANSWHMYDVNKEPNWNQINLAHQSMDFYVKHKENLYKIYDGKLTQMQINYLTETIYYGQPNKFPAPNMLFFHRITKIMTYLLPVFFILMILITLFKQKNPSKLLRKTFNRFKTKRVNI